MVQATSFRVNSVWPLAGLSIFLCLTAFSSAAETARVTVTLTAATADGESRAVPGVIRCTDSTGKPVLLDDLLNRGTGLALSGDTIDREIHSWSVLPGTSIISLPREVIRLEAFSGIESELSTMTLDLSDKTEANVTIPLVGFGQSILQGQRSANTHLHIMKLSRDECDQYLNEIPAADRLDIVFVSHLERAVVDATYITNRYTTNDLEKLSQTTGVLFGWGEEHRHNMNGGPEGYGHVMLLNIQELIQPVSIGKGIMKQGTDGIPLARGILSAKRQGGTVVWCHNGWGRESTPNLFQNNVDAVNIFDGGTRSSFADSFYRWLNAGLRVPFSTGTDWCQYDFSRVYARMEEPLTIDNWLQALRQGRTFITNGPLLDLKVNDHHIGDTLQLSAEEGQLQVRAVAKGRRDFDRLEVVLDGEIVLSTESHAVDGHFEALIDETLPVKKSGWLAIRTPPPSVPDDVTRADKTPLNEYGREIFSHTSPIYIEIDGKKHFDSETAHQLLMEMEFHRDFIRDQFEFADLHERAHVLQIYDDGLKALEQQITTANALRQ
ncbi:MAG: CehA/McbA family metallohydrolase [Planctomycetaceae bacterium]|nr:CehA/McbA family metallohydrolase [Planctomycetaceae bacterium]